MRLKSLSFITILLVTALILGLLFDSQPIPARPSEQPERPRKLTPTEQDDSINRKKPIAEG